VPRSGYEFERIPILDQPDYLKNEWKNVESLLELEMATKVMVGAQHRIKGIQEFYICHTQTHAQPILRTLCASIPFESIKSGDNILDPPPLRGADRNLVLSPGRRTEKEHYHKLAPGRASGEWK